MRTAFVMVIKPLEESKWIQINFFDLLHCGCKGKKIEAKINGKQNLPGKQFGNMQWSLDRKHQACKIARIETAAFYLREWARTAWESK